MSYSTIDIIIIIDLVVNDIIIMHVYYYGYDYSYDSMIISCY